MARIDKSALTKTEIVQEACKQFLEKGYSNTTVSAIAKALGMSPGNLTFHYPTKDHLLSELVEMMCVFQWNLIEEEVDDGYSMVMALCFEFAYIVSTCEDDEIIRDFFLSAYRSPVCLDIIRKNDCERAKEIFKSHRPDWTDEQFASAEILVSGIEYASIMEAGEDVPLETRISVATQNILTIYGIPEDVCKKKIKRVLETDYRVKGKQILDDFKAYVNRSNEQAFRELLKR